MSELKLDRDKCAQRRRIAARRDGVNATPVRFLRGPLTKSPKTIATKGWLPDTNDEAVARINELRPNQDAPPLTADDVFIHYVEAANDNFIGDRYMFMGGKTLENIATDAERGFAFMNSHRTGGLSSPAELPFGRTFAGRYEMTDGEAGPHQRTTIAFYMLKGVQPNGANGPSTDDLHASIEAGTIFDVSVGLWGGDVVCDVCGLDALSRDEDGAYICPHFPGSNVGMTPEEVAAQEARGVTKGRASYTYDNAHCSETSAVYDGAVPGAGFQKVTSNSRNFSPAEWAEFHESFASLFGAQEESVSQVHKPNDPAAPDAKVAAFFKMVKQFFTSAELGEVESAAPKVETPDAESLAAENAQLKADLAKRDEEAKAEREAREKESATAAEALKAEVAAREKEQEARAKAQTSAFVKSLEHTGASARRDMEALYHGAASGTLTLRLENPSAPADATDENGRYIYSYAQISPEASAILTTHLESLAKSFQPAGAKERQALGGEKAEAAARLAGGDAGDPNAEHFEAQARVRAAGVKENTSEFAAAYERELVAGRKEQGVSRGVTK